MKTASNEAVSTGSWSREDILGLLPSTRLALPSLKWGRAYSQALCRPLPPACPQAMQMGPKMHKGSPHLGPNFTHLSASRWRSCPRAVRAPSSSSSSPAGSDAQVPCWAQNFCFTPGLGPCSVPTGLLIKGTALAPVCLPLLLYRPRRGDTPELALALAKGRAGREGCQLPSTKQKWQLRRQLALNPGTRRGQRGGRWCDRELREDEAWGTGS